MLSALALLALLLAATGVYGVIAASVEQRRLEIGIRVAVGASPKDIGSLFIRNTSRMLVPALVFGLAGAAVIVRLLNYILFETSPLNPLAYLAAACVLSTVAAVSTLLPVRRALALTPSAVLRAK